MIITTAAAIGFSQIHWTPYTALGIFFLIIVFTFSLWADELIPKKHTNFWNESELMHEQRDAERKAEEAKFTESIRTAAEQAYNTAISKQETVNESDN